MKQYRYKWVKREEPPSGSSLFHIAIILAVAYLLFALANDLLSSYITFYRIVSALLANISYILSAISRVFSLLAGVFFLISLLRINARHKGAIMAGSILLVFSFLTVVLSIFFVFLLFGINIDSGNVFYIFTATNFLFLLTGILALTLVLSPIATRVVRNLSYLGLAFRVAGSLIAFYSLY